MKRSLLLLAVFCFFSTVLHAQESNPLIDSGPIINEGLQLHDKGKYKEAIELYKKISRSDTNYVWALYELGLSYTADSQFTRALSAYREGLSLDIDREREADFYNSYASLLDDLGEKEKALLVFDSAIAKYPAHSPLLLNKATTLLRLERNAEAEALLKRNLLMDPYSSSSHYLLALAVFRQGKVVPAFISAFSYLMMKPSGPYFQNSINMLSVIANNKDDLNAYIEQRKETPSENHQLLEQIILSKIALDKNYKPLIKLDDAICRQIQVLFEKMEYIESDDDFWMQYYTPAYKNLFNTGKFEPYIYYIFSNVDAETIQSYNKKNQKEVQAVVDELTTYLNEIRSTRELNFRKRPTTAIRYSFNNGKISGKGRSSENGDKLLGNWEFYYDHGNIRSVGSYNDKGERQGKWQYYYYDKTLRTIEHYKNGELDGEVIHYFSNGNLSSKLNFVNGLQEGEENSFFVSGTRKLTEHYSKGKLNGERKIFYPNGMIHYVENYKADSLDGVYESYHQNGVREYATRYANGKLFGTIKGKHENDSIAFEGQYLNGKLHGTWQRYFPNGKLKTIEQYVDGALDGEYKEFHQNGKLYSLIIYKKGKASGEVSYYDVDEKLFSKFTYKNDLLQEAIFYDKSGKEISRSVSSNKKLFLTSYQPDGSKRSELNYNEKRQSDGTETIYYKSGKTRETNQYKDGNLSGTSTGYHMNGKISAMVPYVDNEKDGYYKSNYLDGTLQSEGWYRADQVQGTWFFYDQMGNLISKNEYLDNDLHGFKQDFWPNGKIDAETEYYYGWIRSYKQFDTTGKLIHATDFKKGSGEYSVLQENGKIKSHGNYVNGYFEGVYKFYFFDGSPETIRHYKLGLADSIYRNYYYGGKVRSEGSYKMGEKSGTWLYYYESGKLLLKEQYENGELHGKRTFYYENGQVDVESYLEEGSRQGVSKKFNPAGSLMYQLRFLNDLPVAYSYEDKSGNLIPEIPLPFSSGKVTCFYRDGTPSANFEYVEGQQNGKVLLYHNNGKIYYESRENFNLTEGEAKEYFLNGQLKSVLNNRSNTVTGPFVTYNENGTKKNEGHQYNDMLHGTIFYYDENGKLKETRVYYYDNLLSVKK